MYPSKGIKYFAKDLTWIALGVVTLFIASQLTIPLHPVPITMQTVAVMLIGLIFTRNLSMITISLYLLLGSVGLPMFANFSGGLQILLGPTGGYLWGFLAAVIVMTTLRRYLQNRFIWRVALNCFLGTCIILSCGIAWLAYYIGLQAGLNYGLYPFIVPGLIKIALAVLMFLLIQKCFKVYLC